MEDDIKGAIDTEDNSGAAPVMPVPDDHPGAAGSSSAPAPAQQRPSDGLQAIADAGKQTPLEGAKQFPGNVKRIVSYLMGDGGADPAAVESAGRAVDPQGQMSPDDRNVLAVHQAAETQGPEAAWKLVQGHRIAYNAKQAFAKAALEGTPQKPADIRAAVDAANQAGQHILDGSQIQFAPTPNGVTATVKMPGTSQAQQIPLSPQQFARWVDPGGDGQWDKVMEQSAPAALQRIASSGTASVGPSAAQRRGPAAPAAQAPAPANQPQDAMAQADQGDADPADETKTGKPLKGLVQSPSADPGYGEELENRSKRIFGAGAIGPTEAARQQWMAAQEEKELERSNKIDVQGARAAGTAEVARITAGGRTEAAGINAEAKLKGWQYASDAKLKAVQAQVASKLQQMENSNANSAQTRALKLVQTKLMTGKELAPAEQAFVDKLPGAAQSSQPTTAPQQVQQHGSSPAAPQRPANVPAGAKFYKGTWYTRGANGESVPVQ